MLRGKFFVGYSAVLIFCFSCLPLYAQLSVTKHTIDGNFNSAHWVYATDIDRDGDIDIAAASTAQGLKWYKNNGSGSFTKQSVGSFSGAWSVYAKDVDEDGDVDMLGASARLHEIGWWKNSGSESFTKKVVGSDFKSAESVFAADLDNDGDNDILGAAWEDGELAWWEKKGGDNFTKHILDGNYTNAHSIHAADLDGDGDFDIISCSATKTNWWRNDGNGSFTKKNLGSTGGLGVFAADLDSDGDMDILRTERSNDDIDWFENNGSGGFTLHTIQAAFGNSWSVVAGDVDGDGDRDVVAAAFIDNKISVWLNDGKENFSEVVIDDNLSGPRGVFAADFDADGDEDIAAAVNSDGDVVWYEVTGSPAPPPAVTVLDPNGGEMLEVNATHTIQWTSTGSVSDVDIEFSTDGGSSWNVIVSSAQNTGSFDWLVPDQPSDNALVRVSDATDANISDVSDGVFSIVNPAPAITVTQPNGGELWSIGTDQVITWTSAGVIDSVQLEFSIDGGLSWTIIAASVANDGNYTWTIPDAASDNCLVRISDATDGDPVDTSDAVFTITSELVYVQRVNAGGSEFTGGDGRVWDADQAFVDGAWGYVGGNTFSTTDAIANTTDDVLYQSERHTLTGYSFTVPSSGSYHVELHFAEIFLNEAGGRIFDVSIENALVLDNLDIYAEVGHDAALVKSFDVEVTDGVLDVTFAAVVEEPKISAIEVSITTTTTDSTAPVISNVVASSITSTSAAISWDTDEASDSQVEYGLDSSYGSTTGLDAALVTSHSVTLTGLSASTTYHYRVLSADGNGNLAASGDFTFTTTVAASYVQRVNAGGSAYTGGDGRVWDAEQEFVDGAWGYVGGRTFSTKDNIANTADDVLYQSERYGLDGYSFTLPANGTYHVELHFAEIFENEVGARVFDVFIEDALVLDDLDIFAEVGHDAALVRSFDVDVADGILDITFVKQVGRRKISAIEVSSLATSTALVKAETAEPWPVALKSQNLPKRFALSQNYPNPFNPNTKINYEMPEAGHVVIRIFNVLGRQVRTLVDDDQESGFHTAQWDGTDQFNHTVSSGVYYYQLTVGDFQSTRSMLLLR